MIREFLVPLLLALAGIAAGALGLYASDYARRWIWTLAVGLVFLAALAFIWSEPVRGPFYRITHQTVDDRFKVHGAATIIFTLKDLSRGIDISQRGMKISGDPVNLWVRNNWLLGWTYKMSITVEGKDYNILDGEVPAGWDTNHDDTAVEVVNQEQIPLLQIVTDSDYDIYINLAVIGDPNTLIINNTNPKGGRISQKPTRLLRPEDLFRPLFRYPSYSHRGQRV